MWKGAPLRVGGHFELLIAVQLWIKCRVRGDNETLQQRLDGFTATSDKKPTLFHQSFSCSSVYWFSYYKKRFGVFFFLPFRLCIQFGSQFENDVKMIQIQHDKTHLHQRVLYVGFNTMDRTSELSPSSLTLTEWDILCCDTLRSSFSCTLGLSHLTFPCTSLLFFHCSLLSSAARQPEMAQDYSFSCFHLSVLSCFPPSFHPSVSLTNVLLDISSLSSAVSACPFFNMM